MSNPWAPPGSPAEPRATDEAGAPQPPEPTGADGPDQASTRSGGLPGGPEQAASGGGQHSASGGGQGAASGGGQGSMPGGSAGGAGSWRRRAQQQAANLTPEQRDNLMAANRKVFRFGVLMLSAMIALTLPLPWPVLGLGFWGWGVVSAIKGLRLARKVPGSNTIVFYLVVGLGFSTMVATYALTWVGTWPIQWDYQQCQSSALTIEGADQCLTDRTDRLTNLTGGINWSNLFGNSGQAGNSPAIDPGSTGG